MEKAGKSYQSNLYTKIFGHGGGKRRKLAEVRSIIYRAVPEFKDQIDLEVIATDYRSEKLVSLSVSMLHLVEPAY